LLILKLALVFFAASFQNYAKEVIASFRMQKKHEMRDPEMMFSPHTNQNPNHLPMALKLAITIEWLEYSRQSPCG